MTSKAVVVRRVERPEPDIIDQLRAAGVATVHEAQWRTGLLGAELRPIYPSPPIGGSAITVLCAPGDNLMIHLAVEACQPGDVLIVACNAPAAPYGVLGELLATSLRAHGVVGAILDTGVRDVAMLRRMTFPVWSRAVTASGTTKSMVGSVNVRVQCAGQTVDPGDVIVADEDGVVVVPRSHARHVAAAAAERIVREEEARARLAAGELGVDMYQLRPVAKQLGISYP